jgi:hypothetical protein
MNESKRKKIEQFREFLDEVVSDLLPDISTDTVTGYKLTNEDLEKILEEGGIIKNTSLLGVIKGQLTDAYDDAPQKYTNYRHTVIVTIGVREPATILACNVSDIDSITVKAEKFMEDLGHEHKENFIYTFLDLSPPKQLIN